tara:strand:- start:443 stop:736 length:294 start_codon:yes stop_codon:yes gene_type:complete
MSKHHPKSALKLKRLKENRLKELEKKLLDITLKGQDHYVFIDENNKAQLVYKDGKWISENILKEMAKYNYFVDKTKKMMIRDFKKEELEAYCKQYEN